MLINILFWIFVIISLFSFVVLFYALRRINVLESVIVEFEQVVTYTANKLKQIDSTGHFESDDEVGFFFDEIKYLQDSLSGMFEHEQIEENSSAEEKK